MLQQLIVRFRLRGQDSVAAPMMLPPSQEDAYYNDDSSSPQDTLF